MRHSAWIAMAATLCLTTGIRAQTLPGTSQSGEPLPPALQIRENGKSYQEYSHALLSYKNGTFVSATVAAQADAASDGDAAFHNGDYTKARTLLMPLAQRGNAVAECDIGLMYFGGNGYSRDSREAVKWFLLSAGQGQIGAQVNLAIAYAVGEGVARNPVQAYVWFSAAASQRTGKSLAAKYREHVAAELTPDQLQRAQGAAAQCQATNFRDCRVD